MPRSSITTASIRCGDGAMRGDGGPDGEKRGPSARAMLIAAILFVGLGYYLAVKLHEQSKLQDCLMSGRTNCAPISGDQK